MARARGEATKKILDLLKRGPAFPQKICEELDISISTSIIT
jgi:hypothetical protein